MVLAIITTILLGFINTLVELPGGTAGGRDGCMMAALLITLWATMNTGNLAFKQTNKKMHTQTAGKKKISC